MKTSKMFYNVVLLFMWSLSALSKVTSLYLKGVCFLGLIELLAL